VKWKIIISGVVLCLSVALFFSIKEVFRLREVNQATSSVLMSKNLELGRAETKLGNAETQIGKLSKDIQKEIKDRKAALSLVIDLRAKYEKEVRDKRVETRVVYRDREKKVDLPQGKLFIKEGNKYKVVESLSWSYKDFRITITGDTVKKTLSYKLHQKFRATIAESKLPSGGYNHYVEVFELDDKNKDVDKIRLTNIQAIRSEPNKSKLFWFNPKLDLELGYGVSMRAQSSWVGTVGLSIAGYGITKNDLTWRFLRVGIGGSSDGFIITGSPVSLNIARFLPVLSNVWITPSAGYDFTNGAALFTFGISVVL